MDAAGDTATYVTAAGPRATRVVSRVADIEPELIEFVRTAVRWLDPSFPQSGLRSGWVGGGWTDEEKVETEFVQAEELAPDGRGLRIVRVYRIAPDDQPFEGAVRVVALGAANGAHLELRWNFLADENQVRGTTTDLTVDGAGHLACVADFRSWFD